MAVKYDEKLREKPFGSYNEYMQYIFDCVNTGLDRYLEGMKEVYANEEGGYKNVLYPDLELAAQMSRSHVERFYADVRDDVSDSAEEDEDTAEDTDDEEDIEDDELLSLLGAFRSDEGSDDDYDTPQSSISNTASESIKSDASVTLRDRLSFIDDRAALSVEAGIKLPLYELSHKLKFEPFTLFCFACGILSSTQTDYAGVFQIVNENANLSAPTIESAAKVFYGGEYSITGAYGDMSTCLEQLLPVLSLRVLDSMPFSTVVSPDKRIIDCLFGRNPDKLDENYTRFISMLTNDKELDPIMANQGVLDEMKISYDEGVRIFYYYGDEGSGRRFFVKHFCKETSQGAVQINCKKLFNYDYQFVEKALWAVTRECILTDSCCCLTELSFREEEKEKFFGYMDLAFSKLNEQNVLVFAMSKEHIDFREVTKSEYTELELPTPDTAERQACWEYYAQGYKLEEGIDMLEMSTKFLFTPGKIHDALKHARALSTMAQEKEISRDKLFKGCYNQMSSELTQKATKIKANFGFEDIVMNPSQRETLEHAIDQMNFRKQVYENWHYTK
ncbi:MAG: hypothetical protein IIU07_04210, partial [Lachnospiraceae bacterium]|nr:hypothetical protein [Lachnospiraceae bacterium]